MNAEAFSVATLAGMLVTADPLCATARWNRPCAAGMPSSVLTLPAPPDWPKIVTLAGLPPKPAMLSRIHSRPAMMSFIPTFDASAYFSPPSAGRYRNPKAFKRWVMPTTTTPCLRARFAPSYGIMPGEPAP